MGSSQLALRPRSDSTLIDETDFVNVQAIIARASCQALAYPFLQPALVQLFSSSDGSPGLYLCPAGMFLPFGEDISFADVIRQVKKGHKDDICIGYRALVGTKLQTVFCPKLA